MAIGHIQGSNESLPDDLQSILNELDRTDQQVRQLVSDLSEAQLNWKPGETAWSIAQCLDHLGQMDSKFRLYRRAAGCGAPGRHEVAGATQSNSASSSSSSSFRLVWALVHQRDGAAGRTGSFARQNREGREHTSRGRKC